VLLAAAITAAQPAAAQTASAPQLLSCAGPFAKDASEAALIASFGKANVQREDIDVAEGATEKGNVIFGNDEKRRIEVLWHDAAKRRRPSAITVRDPSSWRVAVPEQPGATLGIGSDLATVEAANGKAFQLYGFEWDMGGYSAGWKDGRLDKPDGGCSLSLRFGPDEKAKEAALTKVAGDKLFASNAPAMRAVKAKVGQITLGWPE
jgi:hypothetical protein